MSTAAGPPSRKPAPPQDRHPLNHTNTEHSTPYRRQDGFTAPAADERREAALLAEVKALGYGITMPCLICHRPLTAAKSLAAHVGPVCAARMAEAVTE